jgi:hypothetical protein
MGYQNSSDDSIQCRLNLAQSWMVKKLRSWSPLPFSEYHSSSSVPCRFILYSYCPVNQLLPNDNTNWISMKRLIIDDKRYYKLGAVRDQRVRRPLKTRGLFTRACTASHWPDPATLAIVASASSLWQPYPAAIVVLSHSHQRCGGPQLRCCYRRGGRRRGYFRQNLPRALHPIGWRRRSKTRDAEVTLGGGGRHAGEREADGNGQRGPRLWRLGFHRRRDMPGWLRASTRWQNNGCVALVWLHGAWGPGWELVNFFYNQLCSTKRVKKTMQYNRRVFFYSKKNHRVFFSWLQ